VKNKTSMLMALALSLVAVACGGSQPTATPTQTGAPPTVTDMPTAVPATTEAAAPATATATLEAPTDTVPPPTETNTPEPPALQFIAYSDVSRQLLVTDVTGGVLGGTTQYSHAEVEGQLFEFAWSPSGEYMAFAASTGMDVSVIHVYYVYALGAGTPVDLGIGLNLAWSPDSTRLAFIRDDNLWQVTLESGLIQQLTLNGREWYWGGPVYTPAGDALLAGGALVADIGAQGNVSFSLYTVPLDGSGTVAPLPGLAAPIDGNLNQYRLRYSPNGALLAFSSVWHLSACASRVEYFVMNADGSDRRGLISPTLITRTNDAAEIYFQGLSLAWTQASDGLLQSGLVRNCSDSSGDLVGDPQMSIVSLTGEESSVVIGLFNSLSFDRTGSLIAAVAYPDPSAAGEVRLYDLSGNLVLTVGPGVFAAMQP